MICDLILLCAATLFFIVTFICFVTEKCPAKKAAVRNFFRRLTISIREIGVPSFLVISGVLLLIAARTDILDIRMTAASVLTFMLGLLLINVNLGSFRRHTNRKKRSKKPMKPINTVPETAEVDELPEAPPTDELPELAAEITE